jgi:hypothetical protein
VTLSRPRDSANHLLRGSKKPGFSARHRGFEPLTFGSGDDQISLFYRDFLSKASTSDTSMIDPGPSRATVRRTTETLSQVAKVAVLARGLVSLVELGQVSAALALVDQFRGTLEALSEEGEERPDGIEGGEPHRKTH